MIKQCPNIIDSHAHLNFYVFKEDKNQIFEDAAKIGAWVINVGSNFETSRKAVELAQEYSIGIFAAVGVHPIHVDDEEFDQECMRDLIQNNERVIAVGETGLDYYHLYGKRENYDNNKIQKLKNKQKKIFLEHLKLARLVNLPLILHCRVYEDMDAYNDMLEILKSFKEKYSDYELRGVLHCFTGDLKTAKSFIKIGFHIGFTGVITFDKEYDKVVKEVPKDKILIETDCPWLAPVPKRGKRNEPKFVEHVADKIAKVKNIPKENVKEFTVENTRNLFNI